MDKERLEYLFDHYFAKTGTDAERHELLDYLQTGGPDDHGAELHRLVTRAFSRAATNPGLPPEAAHRIVKAILQGHARLADSDSAGDPEGAALPETPRRLPWVRRLTAAAVLVLLTGSYLWWNHPKTIQPVAPSRTVVADIAPGHPGAILTLSNGKNIILDSAANGTIAMQGASSVVKQNGGLSYTHANAEKQTLYNTLSTPRGRQYQLNLPDGSKVWLNAASSITYPTAFPTKERKISVTGEAYFEVVKNAAQPFKVRAGQNEIDVLGTSFNVNAYSDENAIQTTLLEGSVKITVGKTNHILQPGQQARVNEQQINILSHPNLDQVMAWKNGYFNFDKLSMQEVLAQISRWYDVEVVYQGTITPKKFGGEIERDLNLSEVLDGLKETGVHFQIDGRKLIVMP
jgi:transmembrane sensor